MIESVNNKKVIYWSKLKDKKYQDIENCFIIEGEHLVEEAFKSGYLLEVIALEKTDCKYEKVTFVTLSVMKKITSLTSVPKIIGIAKKIESRPIKGNVLLLDSINIPGNLGTIIRSAVAFGLDSIIIGSNSVSIYNPKVVRATEGLIFKINIIEGPLEEYLPTLKENNYKIFKTDVFEGTPLSKIEYNGKFAIIMGSEGAGVDKKYDQYKDENLYIEMNEDCESLNVGVAASIILYELNKK